MRRQSTMKTFIFLTILIVGEWSRIVLSLSTEEDLTLTQKEKDALDEFRTRVADTVPHDYMRQDIYLIHWLRAKNLDINQAEDMLRQNVKWRDDNNMDQILKQDFSKMDRDYPYQIRFQDKEGKPIITANFGDWDIRSAAVAGKMEMLSRHINRAFEKATQRVRDLQAEGKVISLWDFIINMEGYSLQKHGCIQCLPIYLNLINSYEQHYPLHADKIMLINTPGIFELVLSLMRPLMSPATRRTLKVYNTNKQQWQAELLKVVDKNQLPVEYGGTREV